MRSCVGGVTLSALVLAGGAWRVDDNTVQVPLDLLRKWCEQQTLQGSRITLEVEVTSTGAVVVERRRPLIGALSREPLRREVARLRLSTQDGWTLEWHDGRHWRRYSRLAPSERLADVLAELERDPCGVFWRLGGDSGGEERRRDVAFT
jgi:hypothetical protein